jgi:hypothetical protein
MINPDEILGKTKVLGRPFNGRTLTVENLRTFGLVPDQEFSIKDRTVYLSKIFKTPARRLGCIAYVSKDDYYVAHTFFLSRSQGVWRLVRRYRFELTEEGREKSNWHDKGYGEESLFIPVMMQYNLRIEKPLLDLGDDAEFAYFGACVSVEEKDSYEDVITKEPIRLKGK